MYDWTDDALIDLALSNPLYYLRIIEGDEDYFYWLDRLMDTTTAEQARRMDA